MRTQDNHFTESPLHICKPTNLMMASCATTRANPAGGLHHLGCQPYFNLHLLQTIFHRDTQMQTLWPMQDGYQACSWIPGLAKIMPTSCQPHANLIPQCEHRLYNVICATIRCLAPNATGRMTALELMVHATRNERKLWFFTCLVLQIHAGMDMRSYRLSHWKSSFVSMKC